MRRLYSTFAGGWPGIGLIVLRLAAGAALVDRTISTFLSNSAVPAEIAASLSTCAAILLLLGLCTPIVGTLLALTEAIGLLLTPTDWRLHLLLAAFGASLAMLGPGLWSVDARLFGWRRIETSPRKS